MSIFNFSNPESAAHALKYSRIKVEGFNCAFAQGLGRADIFFGHSTRYCAISVQLINTEKFVGNTLGGLLRWWHCRRCTVETGKGEPRRERWSAVEVSPIKLGKYPKIQSHLVGNMRHIKPPNLYTDVCIQIYLCVCVYSVVQLHVRVKRGPSEVVGCVCPPSRLMS